MLHVTWNQVVKMIAEAESAHMTNEIMENMYNPRQLWKTLQKIAPTQLTPLSPFNIEIDGQQITDPLSITSAFNNHITKVQLCANSTAPADENLQADINARLLDFIKTCIDDFTQFNIPPMTTKRVEENINRIGGNRATGLGCFGIRII